MRSQFLTIGLLGVTLLAPIKLWTRQATTVSVTFHVCDQSGAPIPGSKIQLVPAPDPAPQKLETDQQGNLSLNLKSGGYSVVISQSGFKNWSESIYVAAPSGEATASQSFPVVLRIGDAGSPKIIAKKDWLILIADAYHVPVYLSPADFHALPHVTITVHNAHTDADESYSGVPLASLLAKVDAPIGTELRKLALTNYVVAIGTDGYAVILSLAEVDPAFHHGQVLVADTRNGQPLAESGPFQLIVSDDKRPARWVRNLYFISVKSLY